ncbi:bromodomain adjacent to zinc finger domain protein 2B-like isoform X6 [Leptotrombidium deliense]|uniref:Bromodomain adjacent to zinc finger domain protein 2B-like isoform X6 n=1 Tax=Leptotrombidium deliense TaxID=299467 RepID=A0A443SQ81_9ACAR|nr:bromodomain adjacent to zinc finger domain protein 2B-like isoform X6 [Leptotrombidium deliense]
MTAIMKHVRIDLMNRTNSNSFTLSDGNHSRRRGRRPKSILTSANSLPIIVVPAIDDGKPKKRGRPPILSPPLNNSKTNDLSTIAIPETAHNSNRLGGSALNLGSTNSHLLQPGWPTFTPSGVIVFPSATNENKLDNNANNSDQCQPDYRQISFHSAGSGEESKRGDTESEEENDEESDSDSQRSNRCEEEDNRRFNSSKLLDENEIRRPLQHGWRRQTLIRCFTSAGLRGDVSYITPCGKKLKSYPEIVRYLAKSNNNSISRDNFSFSPKITVGEFLELVPGKNNDFNVLTEEHVKSKVEEITNSNRRRRIGMKNSRKRMQRTSSDSYSAGSQQSECKPSDYRAADSTSTRQLRPKPSNEEQIVMNMTKAHYNDNFRNEYEMFKRNQEREFKRYQSELQKEQELQKRRELHMMAEIERERRKQHILLVRALDAHKRQEERERKREEMLAEKRAIQERKMQKKKLEMELLRELKKPVDDTMLKDLKPLPTLNRIPGLKLSAKAFADLLMVYEFLHNFGETLGFDMDSLPSLNTLQQAVLNLDECAEEELLSIIHHLLVCVIDDPGIPFNITTLMGQKLKDAPITNFNISEILRLYFQSFATQIRDDSPLDRIEVRLFNILNTGRPFLSLNATQKTEILSFLCNELLCNQAIVRQVDDNIETVSNLRRDKWVVENDVRKYRLMKQKREKKSEEQEEEEESKKNEKLESEVPVGDESGYSDGEENVCVPILHDNDEPEMTNEELDKKLEVLSRKCTMLTNKLNKAIHGLRVNSLGQDRYRRRFWVLPAAGGVFVEGLESGEPEEHDSQRECDVKTEVKEDISINEGSPKVKSEDVEEEKMDISDKNICHEKTEIDAEKNEEEHCQNGEETEKKVGKREEQCENSSLGNADSPWLSPIMASVLAGSMMFGNNSNHSTNGFSPFPFSFPMDLGHSSQKSSQRPWFSILPRMPCSKDTIIDDCGSKPKKRSESSIKDEHDVQNESNQTRLGSLVNNLPTNLFMQAFLYPHILGSLFQQNRNSSFPVSSTPFSAKGACPQIDASQEKSHTRASSPSAGKSDTEVNYLNTQITEADICPALQKRLADQKQEQYSEPQPIPLQYQCGWWRITDPSQLKNLSEVLHERGIRERQLHKYLQKYFTYVSNKCKSNVAELDITELDRKISQECPFGAPRPQSDDEWNREVAVRLDVAVLEQIEALEEKVASSSMQIRGWRPPPRKSSDHSFPFEVSASYETGACPDEDKEDKESDCDESDSETTNPVMIARERLLAAEAVIERRYLKPPLGFKSNTLIVAASNSHSDEFADNAADDNAPNGLLRWRDAVRECQTGSQLALLLHFLESCIAWDKSIMRASCQFCGSGENEAQLLLCDSCDKGYHTYCFKPKMETIPEGNWYCFECQNKNTIDKVCIVCGKKGKLLNCDTCPKVFHPNCIDPPVTKPPKGRWSCNMCNRKPKKPKYTRKTPASANNSVEEKPVKEVLNSTPVSAAKETKKSSSASKSAKSSKAESSDKDSKKDKKSKEKDKELSVCDTLLSEMEKHDDAWPFLFPVNTKQFPTYKKIIKKPMDLTTIRNKLENGSYKSKSEFMNDCKLIFDNCETFNEDESPVGIAGHNMRAFCTKRAKELMDKI